MGVREEGAKGGRKCNSAGEKGSICLKSRSLCNIHQFDRGRKREEGREETGVIMRERRTKGNIKAHTWRK